MELVLVTKSRNIGIDEEYTGLLDLDYFSVLPQFDKCIGLISKKSMKMLEDYRRRELYNNIVDSVYIKNRNCFHTQCDEFYLYNFKSIKPVLYEVPGFNCIINFKEDNYLVLETLKSFFFRDSNFFKNDFDSLEYYTDYLISSYYEGEASFLYTKDSLVPIIIESFNRVCMNKCGSEITIEEL